MTFRTHTRSTTRPNVSDGHTLSGRPLPCACLAVAMTSLLLGGCSSEPGTDGASIDAPPQHAEQSIETPREPDATADSTPDAEDTDTDTDTETRTVAFVDVAGPVPASWTAQPPSSNMRAGQFLVPGASPSENAEVVFFYFGPGSGGSVESNIDRWRSQFRTVDGQSPEPTVQTFESDGMPVTFVELSGDHRGMGATDYASDRVMLAGIVESPQGPIFIHFVGPAQTVEAHRSAFLTLLQGLERQ